MSHPHAADRFQRPPEERTESGAIRRVGIELEMSGISPEEMAAAVMDVVGGRLHRTSPFESTVNDSKLGDFRIELDADVLKSRGYQKHLAEMGIDIGEGQTRENIEQAISKVAGLVVPLELVGPPVPWTELEQLDAIRLKLREAGARGTHSSPFYAFGMHMNIEAASLEATHLLALVRAFLLRYEWLVEVEDVDLSRRVTPYVQPYPPDYVEHVLDFDYQPDLQQFIDDVLELTPTRNRPLDLLPLLAHIDRERIMAGPVEKDLIKPRPAWHYRLPNCLIDEADWSLAVPWNHWVEVERLAGNPDELEAECARFMSTPGGLKGWLAGLIQRLWS